MYRSALHNKPSDPNAKKWWTIGYKDKNGKWETTHHVYPPAGKEDEME
jgi:hypothetical protein